MSEKGKIQNLERGVTALKAERDYLRSTLVAVQRVVDEESVLDQHFGDDWVLVELIVAALTSPPQDSGFIGAS